MVPQFSHFGSASVLATIFNSATVGTSAITSAHPMLAKQLLKNKKIEKHIGIFFLCKF
jgi:hypothetical protein